MSDLTVRPDGPEGQPDNVTPTHNCVAGGIFPPPALASSYTGPVLDAIREQIEQLPRHFAALADAHTLCGLERATVRWTDDPATPVDCPACTVAIVDEQFGPDGKTAAEMASETAEPQPERRTVSLEVLTDELREAENLRRRLACDESPFPVEPVLVPENARVGVIIRRTDGRVSIPDVDTDWSDRYPYPASVLGRLLEQARFHVSPEMGDELLMPTPDVLAALDGRDPGLWTGWVPVVYRHVQPGWQVMTMPPPPSDPTPELVANTASCDVDGCENGVDCVVLTLPSGKVHMTSWRSVHVRIPASVTR